MALPIPSPFDEQSGVATRRQLLDGGHAWAFIRSQIDAGRWRELNEKVVVGHNGPLTWRQRLWAVYLSAPDPAGICGLSSLQSWRVKGFETDDVHVLVGRGARVLPVDGVKVVVHESRRFSAADVVMARRPPCTRVSRAAVDAAAWSPNVWTAMRVFVAPVQQRRETAVVMRAALLEAGHIRYRRQLLALAADMCGGAEALSEAAFLGFCRRHEFPTPRCQRRMDRAGRWRFLDAEFELPNGRIVRVEVDGGVHVVLSVRAEDNLKDNDATLAGKGVLRYASPLIYGDDPRAVAQLRRALGLVSVR